VQFDRARVAIVGGVAALLFWTSVGLEARAQAVVEVPIRAFAYEPTVLVVPVGTTVVWTNHDPVAHTVTDLDWAYDSGSFGESESFSTTFSAPGAYEYYCVPHPTMIGRIEVTG
jgi:plastocyanin